MKYDMRFTYIVTLALASYKNICTPSCSSFTRVCVSMFSPLKPEAFFLGYFLLYIRVYPWQHPTRVGRGRERLPTQTGYTPLLYYPGKFLSLCMYICIRVSRVPMLFLRVVCVCRVAVVWSVYTYVCM